MSTATLDALVLPPNLSDHKWGRCYGKVYINQHQKAVLRCCVCDSKHNNYQQFIEHIFVHYYKSKTIKEAEHRTVDTKVAGEKFDVEQEISQLNMSPIECMLEIPIRDSTLESGQKTPAENPLGDASIEEELCENKIAIGETRHENHVHSSSPAELSSDSSHPSTSLLTPKTASHDRETSLKPADKDLQNERPHKCATCGHAFKTRYALKLHSRRHTGDARFVCDICEKRFYTGSELRIHKRSHTGDRPFVCTICGARFTSSSWRNRHEKQHEHRMKNIRKHKCEQCGKCFLEASNLKTHYLVHTGERKFACTICNRRFLQSKHLYEHKKIHANARQYACNICGRAFNQSSARVLHMKNKHKVVKAAPHPETQTKTTEPQQQE